MRVGGHEVVGVLVRFDAMDIRFHGIAPLVLIEALGAKRRHCHSRSGPGIVRDRLFVVEIGKARCRQALTLRGWSALVPFRSWQRRSLCSPIRMLRSTHRNEFIASAAKRHPLFDRAIG